AYSDVSDVEILPREYNLVQNYPNPFNPATAIKYSLAAESRVRLTIYNSIGQIVSQLINTTQGAGSYNILWNAGNIPSGVYFYSLEASSVNNNESFRSVRKMLLLK
ncbi:MAG: T9SS type A sorting domain-containing protein, partial [Bacillota bacterium]